MKGAILYLVITGYITSLILLLTGFFKLKEQVKELEKIKYDEVASEINMSKIRKYVVFLLSGVIIGIIVSVKVFMTTVLRGF